MISIIGLLGDRITGGHYGKTLKSCSIELHLCIILILFISYFILYIYLLLHWEIKYPIIVFGQRVGMLFTEFYLFHFCIFIAEHDQLSFADIHGFPDLVVRETLYVLTLSVCLFLANKFKPILIINDVLECSIKTSGKQK